MTESNDDKEKEVPGHLKFSFDVKINSKVSIFLFSSEAF